jgi:hypothetical protein
MTGREKLVATRLIERAKEILGPDVDDDIGVNATVFHLYKALEELRDVVPESDGVPA